MLSRAASRLQLRAGRAARWIAPAPPLRLLLSVAEQEPAQQELEKPKQASSTVKEKAAKVGNSVGAAYEKGTGAVDRTITAVLEAPQKIAEKAGAVAAAVKSKVASTGQASTQEAPASPAPAPSSASPANASAEGPASAAKQEEGSKAQAAGGGGAG
eukprot:tig00000342_g24233.t1